MKCIDIILIIIIFIILIFVIFNLLKHLKLNGGIKTYYSTDTNIFTPEELIAINNIFDEQSDLYYYLPKNMNSELYKQMEEYKKVCDKHIHDEYLDTSEDIDIFLLTRFEVIHFLIVASKFYNCLISSIKFNRILGEGVYKIGISISILNSNYVLSVVKFEAKYNYNNGLCYDIKKNKYDNIINQLKINKELLQDLKQEKTEALPKIYLSSLDLLDINDNYTFKNDKLPIVWYLVEECKSYGTFDEQKYSDFAFKLISYLSKYNLYYFDWHNGNFMCDSKNNEYVLIDFDMEKTDSNKFKKDIQNCCMVFGAIKLLIMELEDKNEDIRRIYNKADYHKLWKYKLCLYNKEYYDYMDERYRKTKLSEKIINNDCLEYLLDKNSKYFNETIYNLYKQCVDNKIIPVDMYEIYLK